ncbi:DNA-3-methyladenine glycosylase [Ahniella affigens]|uniref:DNA-3-methyladenine glycosylase II n=1 Tax=Ahniella affigens TaxID=2021234 RepID=A0A2P1PYB1_9GAMM|nr:DNA-3-methyladenine glycosylase [Ahniella affigens]AVP99832.1 DNA-3-methyladenine glycosylase [Ahniella affigens]
MPKINHPRGFDLESAHRSLRKAEPRFKAWMRKIQIDVDWHRPFDPVDALANAILYQQLSGKAAATIVGRVRAQHCQDAKGRMTADNLARAPAEGLRACGVSGNKALALKDLAEKAQLGVVPNARSLRYLSDEELIERLTQVRGIGRWTVEMMLIFRLGRPDVFPIDDLGVRKGAQVLLELDEMPKPKALLELGQDWSPHRTLASLYLWRIADSLKPVRAPTPRSQD